MTPQIGAKIRRLRLAKGLRLVDLAKKVECSESMLSKIEKNQRLPSVITLQRLTKELDTNVEWLIAEAQESDVILREQDRTPVSFKKFKPVSGTVIERIAPFSEDSLLQMMLFTVDPGGETKSNLTYRGEDFGYVLDGELEILVDDVAYHLRAGDAFQFASERPHGFRNKGAVAAKIIWVNTAVTQ